MRDRQSLEALLARRFPAASHGQIAAAANAIMAMTERWETEGHECRTCGTAGMPSSGVERIRCSKEPVDARRRSRRVLVVDDEPLIRWSVAETLADAGFHVVQRADAKGARAALAQAHDVFDAVVLDLRLPDSSDLSLLRSLHAMAPSAALILTTANNTPDLEREALDSGACRVLGKPFEVGDLARAVADAAGRSPSEVFPMTAE